MPQTSSHRAWGIIHFVLHPQALAKEQPYNTAETSDRLEQVMWQGLVPYKNLSLGLVII